MTVVIPTLGRPILEQSLKAIALGATWPAEVIVVDQGQSPDVAALARELNEVGLRVRHVPSSERGRAIGVNTGIALVRTRHVAVTDDDCLVTPDWVRRMSALLDAHPGCIVSGGVEAAGDEPVLAVSTGDGFHVQRRPRLRFDRFCGGNFATSLAVLHTTGPLDEDPCLRTAEDTEFAYRALRAGVPIVYAPDALVRHVGWRDAAQRERQYRDYATSHGGFYGKYLRTGDWFIAGRAVAHLARAARRWARGVIAGDRELALHGRAYVTGLVPGIVSGWRSGRP